MLGMSALEDLCAKKELSKTALLHAMTGAAPLVYKLWAYSLGAD
jgi:hypothetical protein